MTICIDNDSNTPEDDPSNSIITVLPLSTHITPGAPTNPITGAQFDLLFNNSLATITTVSDGTKQVTSQHTITINNIHQCWDGNQDGEVNVQDLSITAYYFGETVA